MKALAYIFVAAMLLSLAGAQAWSFKLDIEKKNKEMPKQAYNHIEVLDTIGFHEYAEEYKKEYSEEYHDLYVEHLSYYTDSVNRLFAKRLQDTTQTLINYIHLYNDAFQVEAHKADSLQTVVNNLSKEYYKTMVDSMIQENQ